jgi:hypothetical protein
MLSRLRKEGDLQEKYEKSFRNWSESLSEKEIRAWSLERFWEITVWNGHTVYYKTKSFIEQWIRYVLKSIGTSPNYLLSDSDALNLIKNREMDTKRGHSRFINQKALSQWSGASGVGRLVYRWPTVKVFLNDLRKGLDRRD